MNNIFPNPSKTLIERIDAALDRIKTGRAPMQIPVHEDDVDIVLAECREYIAAAATPYVELACPQCRQYVVARCPACSTLCIAPEEVNQMILAESKRTE